jgi:hypothetical protein
MPPKRKKAKRANANEGGNSPPRASRPSSRADLKRLEDINLSLMARVAELEAREPKDKNPGERGLLLDD